MHYVYRIESLIHPDQHYTGYTADLRQRIIDHNRGCNPATTSFRPWRLKTYLAFDDKHTALAFEAYLKSGSGHAFARKRLWP